MTAFPAIPIQTVSTIAIGRAKYDTDQRRPRDYTEADVDMWAPAAGGALQDASASWCQADARRSIPEADVERWRLTRTDRWSTLSIVEPIASAFAPCGSKPSSAAPRPR